jgi:hypothetical protein
MVTERTVGDIFKTKRMKVLIGCEKSGIIREAFVARGHDAWSCDILPTDIPGNHLQCDVREVLEKGWDLAIFHPPCTYICFSGIRWNVGNPERMRKHDESLDFVRLLLNAPIPRIALENPVGVITRHIRKWDQKIQPWQFGHEETKAHCLWLKNLPTLVPTKIMERRLPVVHMDPGGYGRAERRSRSYKGIGEAMADQWGGIPGYLKAVQLCMQL